MPNSIIDEIALERTRQQLHEDWTPEHDDDHDMGELAQAAMAYCHSSFAGHDGNCHIWWPSEWGAMKRKTPRRDLIRAAAMIVAEIERLDRAALSAGSNGN